MRDKATLLHEKEREIELNLRARLGERLESEENPARSHDSEVGAVLLRVGLYDISGFSNTA